METHYINSKRFLNLKKTTITKTIICFSIYFQFKMCKIYYKTVGMQGKKLTNTRIVKILYRKYGLLYRFYIVYRAFPKLVSFFLTFGQRPLLLETSISDFSPEKMALLLKTWDSFTYSTLNLMVLAVGGEGAI